MAMGVDLDFYISEVPDHDSTDSSTNSLDFLNTDFDFSKEFTCQQYTVKATSVVFFPNLAYVYYGDKNLWWVIAGVNGIVNPLQKVEGGTMLLIPQKSQVLEEISLAEKRKNYVSSASSMYI